MSAPQFARRCRFELLEPRQLMAADFQLGVLPEPRSLGAAGPSDLVADSTGSIHGQVQLMNHDDSQGGISYVGMPGVRIRLLDENGLHVAETVTDGVGEYQFLNVEPGIYGVHEIQPAEYVTRSAAAGSGGGIVFDSNLVGEIVLTAGSHFSGYNFQEQTQDAPSAPGGGDRAIFAHGGEAAHHSSSPVEATVLTAFWQNYDSIEYGKQELTQSRTGPLFAEAAGDPQPVATDEVEATSQLDRFNRQRVFAWRLQIVDDTTLARIPQQRQVQSVEVRSEVASWKHMPLDAGVWWTTLVAEDNGEPSRQAGLGRSGAQAVVGDWDGDGRFEFGLFIDGAWYFDLNRNGRWDAGDAWASLGDATDLPVTGDWNGDEKTDIGVFGPNRPLAVAISEQKLTGVPRELAATGVSTVAALNASSRDPLRESSLGHLSADAVDHVFRFGSPGDLPVTGDWNGDGVESIAVFRAGTWHIDRDGDGRMSEADSTVQFGEKGDVPIVGDWTGDGIDQLGVFRQGTWILDINSDQVLDPQDLDRAFQLGEEGDQPVVGDWNADGVDDIGTYQPGATEPRIVQRRAS